MNSQDAAGALYQALLGEAGSGVTTAPSTKRCFAAIEDAPTPHEKVALLQSASLVPAGLASTIADALLALDPATHSPTPTPSGTSMPHPELHRIRDALITVVDASPQDNTPSDTYEIQVFGVSVLIRRRAQWGPTTDVPYIHIENQDGATLLLVEVNNSGEHEHHTDAEGTAA